MGRSQKVEKLNELYDNGDAFPARPFLASDSYTGFSRAGKAPRRNLSGLVKKRVFSRFPIWSRGVVKALRKALADYTANVGGQGGADPTIDKEALIKRILETIEKVKSFLKERDFELKDLTSAVQYKKMGLIRKGANAACGSIEDKKNFHNLRRRNRPPVQVRGSQRRRRSNAQGV